MPCARIQGVRRQGPQPVHDALLRIARLAGDPQPRRTLARPAPAVPAGAGGLDTRLAEFSYQPVLEEVAGPRRSSSLPFGSMSLSTHPWPTTATRETWDVMACGSLNRGKPRHQKGDCDATAAESGDTEGKCL